jgi:hypothetical protein
MISRRAIVPIDASAACIVLYYMSRRADIQVRTLTTKPQRVIVALSFRATLASHPPLTPQSTLHVVLVYAATIIRDPNRACRRVDPAINVRRFGVDGIVDQLVQDGGVGWEGDGGLDELGDTVGELRDGMHSD